MIVKMVKALVVVRKAEQDRLLDKLRDLGVVHLEPVEPARAVPREEVQTRLAQAGRALQILAPVEPAGPKPDLTPAAAAEEVLQIERRHAERQSRLAGLYRQLQQQALWGDLRAEQLAQLRQGGLELRFWTLDAARVEQVQADLVQIVGRGAGNRVVVAVVDRSGAAEMPEGAELAEFPARDNPSLRAEAAQIDAAMKHDLQRLGALAHLRPAIAAFQKELQEQAEYDVALHGGLYRDDLFALQGWVPASISATLADRLDQAGIKAAVEMLEATEEDRPPTLIKYAWWARPIKGLFEILGTFPGYRELDLSGFFMLALPIFAAILIGDAGYGLVFLLPGVLFYKKLAQKAGKAKTQLLIVIGLVTMVYGVLSANYFGITPDRLAIAGGYTRTVAGATVADFDALMAGHDGWARAARAMMRVAPLWDMDPEKTLMMLIKLSFILGSIHLILAHLRKAAAYWPDLRVLAELGWSVFLAAMLGVIWSLFFGAQEPPPVPMRLVYAGLMTGAVLAILFGNPSRNPIKRVALGIASSLLPSLGTFSDTMSYIRLMAVGMASYYIAAAFNQLAANVADVATWVAGAPILIFGHALNIALTVIAIFAHGVRLNMLEFSNNAGVEWGGYAYAPFAKHTIKES